MSGAKKIFAVFKKTSLISILTRTLTKLYAFFNSVSVNGTQEPDRKINFNNWIACWIIQHRYNPRL